MGASQSSGVNRCACVVGSAAIIMRARRLRYTEKRRGFVGIFGPSRVKIPARLARHPCEPGRRQPYPKSRCTASKARGWLITLLSGLVDGLLRRGHVATCAPAGVIVTLIST